MAYVPGARYRTKTYGHNTKFYRRFREVREKPRVKFSYKQRVRSEAVSTKLANSMVNAFRSEKLPVQPYKPVRNRVIRGRRAWIPAVLRSSEVPAKVLVEMVNLKNADDAKLLTKVETRDRLADALLRGLYDYFGEKPPQTSPAKRASR
jgi:N-acetylmuramoyl-L-alanine amidase